MILSFLEAVKARTSAGTGVLRRNFRLEFIVLSFIFLCEILFLSFIFLCEIFFLSFIFFREIFFLLFESFVLLFKIFHLSDHLEVVFDVRLREPSGFLEPMNSVFLEADITVL